jgi:hypothetical protein
MPNTTYTHILSQKALQPLRKMQMSPLQLLWRTHLLKICVFWLKMGFFTRKTAGFAPKAQTSNNISKILQKSQENA